MYSYEVVEAIECHYKDDIELQILILKELAQSTQVERYQKEMDTLCRLNGLCPKCLEPLMRIVHNDRHGDNYTFDEKVTEFKCKKCDRNHMIG